MRWKDESPLTVLFSVFIVALIWLVYRAALS